MKYFSNLLISIIFALLLVLVAVFSIQNITDVSIKFFVFQSIQLPVGILLTLTFGIGLILGNMLINLSPTKKPNRKFPKPPSQFQFQSESVEEENDPLFDWE